MKLPSPYGSLVGNKSECDGWEVKVHDSRMTEYTFKDVQHMGKMDPPIRFMIRLTVFEATPPGDGESG